MQRGPQRINTTLLSNVVNGELSVLKAYCDNGNNREKFYEIMSLGILDEGLRHSLDKGKTAIAIASKNSHLDILNFIITEANKDDQGRRLLANYLIETNQEGKNPLHESAGIPNNHQVLTLLCTAAHNLSSNPPKPPKESDKHFTTYVSNPDSELGSTALHFAARQCAYSNFDALLKAGADINMTSKNNLTALQLVSKNSLANSCPFMRSYLQTPAGHGYFKNRHGYDLGNETNSGTPPDKKMSPNLLEVLIEIDLNIDLRENDQAQLEAAKKTLELLMKTPPDKEPDFTLLLSNLSTINYSIIQPSQKDLEIPQVKILQEAIMKANAIVPKSNAPSDSDICNKAKQAFITAELFLNMKNIAVCNREALTNFGSSPMMSAYPTFALDGLRQINIELLKDNEKTLLARRLVIAHTNILLNQLKSSPIAKSGLISSIFSSKETRQPAIKCLEKFQQDLRDADSIRTIERLIQSLPDVEHISKLKADLLNEISKPTLKPALAIAPGKHAL